MTRTDLHDATSDANLVDEMMNSRGRVLGATEGLTMALVVISVAMFVIGSILPRPYVSFAAALFTLMMAGALALWCIGERRAMTQVSAKTPPDTAALNADLVDEMMNYRGNILGAVGGLTLAMAVISMAMLVAGFVFTRPYVSFGASLYAFLVAAGLALWCVGEYRQLVSIDERRRKAAERS